MSEEKWKAFNLLEEIERQASSGGPYNEFLRVPALCTGIYSLKAGSKDLQGPHDEDEVYVVIKGRGQLKMADREIDVSPGTILYVGACAEHSFFEITEDLTLLVFFASGGADS